MSVRIVVNIFIIVILLGLGFLGLVYIPLLPLFVQVWFLEIFGDVQTNSKIAVVSIGLVAVISYAAYIKYVKPRGFQQPTFVGIIAMILGLILVITGATEFGEAWEIMQFQQQFSRTNDIYDTALCQQFVWGCLLEGGGYRFLSSSQFPKAIMAEIIWYSGLAMWIIGMVFPQDLKERVNEVVFED